MRWAGILRLALLLAGLVVALALLRSLQGEERRPLPERVEGPARVVDGDTLRVGALSIRLLGMDAPELAQACTAPGGLPYACGEAARTALRNLIDRRPVVCHLHGLDRYRRALGRCDVDGEDVGASLVRAGLAVGYRGYAEEEREARERRRGLWAGSFQRPEEWRREHRTRPAR